MRFDDLGRVRCFLKLRLLNVLLLLVLAGVAQGYQTCQGADLFDSPLNIDDIDVKECKVIHIYRTTREELPATPEVLSSIFGFNKECQVWSGGNTLNRGPPADVYHYFVAFKHPVKIASMLAPGRLPATWEDGACRFLKKDAPYPGDLEHPEQWIPLEGCTGRTQLRMLSFPEGSETRMLWFTDERGRGSSEIPVWRMFSNRLMDVTPLARPYASGEYAQFKASNIQSGSDKWAELPQGKNKPTWLVLTWESEVTLRGLYLDDNFQEFEISTFTGPNAVNPVLGTDSEWKALDKAALREQDVAGERHTQRFIAFNPIQTRGLKIKVSKLIPPPANPPVHYLAEMYALHAFSMANDPLPQRLSSAAPFKIACPMPDAGMLTLAINDSQGQRIRNLVARVERAQGANDEHWDLRDENGNYVAPGHYRWTAITHPGLELRYEMTPYPNIGDNSPSNSAWMNGKDGPGGWMSDHAETVSVATAGERCFFGAITPEHGTGFICTDLSGKRLWGIHSFSSFASTKYLAADGDFVFASCPGENDRILRVNATTQDFEPFLQRAPTTQLRTGITGLAAHDGKLYVAIHAKSSWLDAPTVAEDVDLPNCVPAIAANDRHKHFLRLFRLVDSPPGSGRMGKDHKPDGLTWLESTHGSEAQQHIVLAFTQPVPLGSVVFPRPETKMALSILKADAPYPPDPLKESMWTPFEDGGKCAWDVVAAPPNTMTRALRITFTEPAEPPKDKSKPVKSDPKAPKKATPAADDGSAGWSGRLEGMKLLRRRFTNLFSTAVVRVNSGSVTSDGVWDAQRTKPVTAQDPAIYMLEWKEAQALRGLAIEEIDGMKAEIEAYCGPPGAPIDISGAKDWESAGTYVQTLRHYHSGGTYDYWYNPAARYLDGYVDFGREIKTRALRLRIVEQYSASPGDSKGFRQDRGATNFDTARCHVYGVAPLQYIGGEAPIDPKATDRIEIYDESTKALEKQFHVPDAGKLAWVSSNELYTLSDKKILKVNIGDGTQQTIITDLMDPSALACDASGQIFVYDGAPERQVVRVYDPSGKYERSIGTPGGVKVGAWDPTRMSDVSDIAIDKQNQLWVVNETMYPKRVSLWSAAGEFKKEFLGNTKYGGGGVLDPWDKSRLIFGPMEFELNWETGKTRLKNVTWLGDTPAGEVPVRINDRTYFVTRSGMYGTTNGYPSSGRCAVVYIYENDHLKRCAAMGIATAFRPFSKPELLNALNVKTLEKQQFTWTDRNGDGEVQADEVTLSPAQFDEFGDFGRDLSVVGSSQFNSQSTMIRFFVKEFLPNGAPVYAEQPWTHSGNGIGYAVNDKNLFVLSTPNRMLNADGKTVWTYKTLLGPGVHRWTADTYSPDQVMMEFGVVGHETAHAGALGEFLVTNSNTGCWNVWTTDGLLASRIFRDKRDPLANSWSMLDHQRGLRLDDVNPFEEHFSGYFCRSMADNKYYIVAGKNHASVVEVSGFENFKRCNGEIKVDAADLQAAQAWERQQQQKKIYTEAPVLACRRFKTPPVIDGDPGDREWTSAPVTRIRRTTERGEFDEATLRAGFDDNNLYFLFETFDLGPLKNTGKQLDRIFKSGGCLDLQLGTDPNAPFDRQTPAAGDCRLLLSKNAENKTIATLYRSIVPGTPKPEWSSSTPSGGTTVFDKVQQLDKAVLAQKETKTGYVAELSVPLKELGLKLAPELRLKFDWGIIVGSHDGNEVLRRIYWVNKIAAVTADEPTEARLFPGLWGTLRFTGDSSP